MASKKVSRNAQRLLTVREIVSKKECDQSDGGGLYLRVRGGLANKVYRFTAASGKRREMGLGPGDRRDTDSAGTSVTAARENAEAARRRLCAGVDPIEHRQVEKRAARAVTDLERAAT